MKQLKLIIRIIKEHSVLGTIVPWFIGYWFIELITVIGGWTRSSIHSVIDTIIDYLSHM